MATAESPPRVEAAHEEGRFDGVGGQRISHQAWIPAEPRAAVVVAHGAAEHGGRYGHLVERLVPEGFAVHALDHRGHGRSEGQRAQIDRMDAVVADLDHEVELVRQRHPGRPVFLLGHSMGGTVAVAYAAVHQAKLAGLVLSAPLVLPEPVPGWLLRLLRLASRVVPNLGVLQLDGAAISRDPAEVEAYRADPLNWTGKLPARTVLELVTTAQRIPSGLAPALTLPLLVMQGSADELVEPEGARALRAAAGSWDSRLTVYDGYSHELFNEPSGARDQPLDETAQWLLDRS